MDDTTTNSHHYVQAIVKEFMPVAVPHKCMKVNQDVNLDVMDDVSILLVVEKVKTDIRMYLPS